MRGANDEVLETATKAAFELVVEDLACILSSSLSVHARHAQVSVASAGINQSREENKHVFQQSTPGSLPHDHILLLFIHTRRVLIKDNEVDDVKKATCFHSFHSPLGWTGHCRCPHAVPKCVVWTVWEG